MQIVSAARGLLARTDLENEHKNLSIGLVGEKLGVVRDNAIAAGLELANTIPGVSFFSGIATLGYAGFKVAQGANRAVQASILAGWVGSGVRGSGAHDSFAQAGKMAVLGTLAIFAGPVGNAVNGAAFVKDTADAINTSIAPPR